MKVVAYRHARGDPRVGCRICRSLFTDSRRIYALPSVNGQK
jgi:hypothetical protein